jgi:beta-glucosidase
VVYSERLLVGYRWFQAKHIAPLFCFGYGLSYTHFAYSNLSVSKLSGSRASVSFTLRNTGGRAGTEIPQVYVGFPKSAGEPPLQLKGYQRITLDAGDSTKVTIGLNPRSFAYWSTKKGWTVAPGTYRIDVGTSSCQISLRGGLQLR